LVEQGDLAGATSSASTKLIHGGLRYLEHFEFGLVREALRERERLMAAAPHLIRPLTFVLPYDRSMRPRMLIRAGLFLYDHLAPRRSLAGARQLDLNRSPLGAGLKPDFKTGFSYSDCSGDDSRLVVLNARDAASRGAAIRTRTRLANLHRHETHWQAAFGDGTEAEARILVNAAGGWVDQIAKMAGLPQGEPLALVKGSHIVTRRLFEGPQAYILQNEDRRIVFAIPYEDDFTLIGTTDIPFAGAPGPVTIDEAEIRYLCQSVNRYLKAQIGPSDIVWSYAGLRALQPGEAGNPAALSRDYSLDLDLGGAPLITILGGKITTFRALAEHVLGELRPHLPQGGGAWTDGAVLPGGAIAGRDLKRLEDEIVKAAPFLRADAARRWARSYGTLYHEILDGADKLGRDFGAGLTEGEVRYLKHSEWALSAEDILWRRSKLGLRIGAACGAALTAYLKEGA
jgi:glycerol-3-phosphate dehydrogenase